MNGEIAALRAELAAHEELLRLMLQMLAPPETRDELRRRWKDEGFTTFRDWPVADATVGEQQSAQDAREKAFSNLIGMVFRA